MAAYPQHAVDPTSFPDIDSMPDSALLRLPSILALFQCGRSTWFYWMKQGRAPQPVRVGPRMVAWRAGEVRPLLAGRSGTPIDPNVAKATADRMAKARAARTTEAEKARRRAELLGV